MSHKSTSTRWRQLSFVRDSSLLKLNNSDTDFYNALQMKVINQVVCRGTAKHLRVLITVVLGSYGAHPIDSFHVVHSQSIRRISAPLSTRAAFLSRVEAPERNGRESWIKTSRIQMLETSSAPGRKNLN
ncbi:hypothetical protein RvY_15978 [Ramazzottius varieornatus]|uniref:Uncharacterized protein n=1 Tax=Ramazzottius varieornatus TaxID=947166 RepID=A0A1D1VWT7_RAMVA|nr:hypothetical protein RvY_15978 [Ramazzottius varieornatus]